MSHIQCRFFRIAALAFGLVAASLVQAKEFPDADVQARSPAPAWVQAPDLVIDVTWTRSATSPAFLFGGVCHLFFADRTEDDMASAESQLERCVAQAQFQKAPLTTATPAPGVRRIHLHRAATNGDVQRMHAELLVASSMAKASGWAPSAFYFEAPGGVCMIVANEMRAAIGHEIVHCYKGAWHGNLPPLKTPGPKQAF